MGRCDWFDMAAVTRGSTRERYLAGRVRRGVFGPSWLGLADFCCGLRFIGLLVFKNTIFFHLFFKISSFLFLSFSLIF